MNFPRSSVRSVQPAKRRLAFSLVEVCLGLGIMAFALIAMLGILPTGLGLFANTIDESKTQAIGQQVLSEAKQMDFAQLASLESYRRYFGSDLDQQDSPTAETAYTATITVTKENGVLAPGRPLTLALQIFRTPGGIAPSSSRSVKKLVSMVACKDLSLLTRDAEN